MVTKQNYAKLWEYIIELWIICNLSCFYINVLYLLYVHINVYG